MSDENEKTFDAKYVKELRDEAARYRTRLREYEAPFSEFNDAEREYLFDIVATLANNPEEGAVKVRTLAKNILKDKFYEGLDDLPQPEVPEQDETTPKLEEEEAQVAEHQGLTAEQLQKMLDEREARAREEAEIEGIFREIEEAGFQRGTEGFLTALSLAQTQASLGKDVDFKALAPKVHAIIGTEAEGGDEQEQEQEQEGDKVAEAAEGAAETAVAGDKDFPKTPAAAGTVGAVGEPKQDDWLAKAAEQGKSPLEAARERMEARLG